RRPFNHEINCLRTAYLRRAMSTSRLDTVRPSVRLTDLSSTVETRARLVKDYPIPLWAPDSKRVAAWESVNKTKG
ncbi:hypothetical protein GE21DRAFT_1213698, partial [Neurospora crassa]